jgi:hypothetical protein
MDAMTNARKRAAVAESAALDLPATEVQVDKGGVTRFGKVEFGIKHTLNVAPYLSAAELGRKREEHLRQRKGVEMRRRAVLDPVTVLNIHKKHGINAYNLKGDDGKKLMAIIEREYPHLKTTNKKISRQGDKHAPKLVFGPATQKRQTYAHIPKECL